MLKKLFSSLLAMLLIGILSGCGGGSSDEGANAGTAGEEVRVEIVDFKFSPREAKVQAGGTVIWANKDAATHHLKFAEYEWEPEELRSGMEMDHEFDEPGEYEYECEIHKGNPDETGTIIVE